MLNDGCPAALRKLKGLCGAKRLDNTKSKWPHTVELLDPDPNKLRKKNVRNVLDVRWQCGGAGTVERTYDSREASQRKRATVSILIHEASSCTGCTRVLRERNMAGSDCRVLQLIK